MTYKTMLILGGVSSIAVMFYNARSGQNAKSASDSHAEHVNHDGHRHSIVSDIYQQIFAGTWIGKQYITNEIELIVLICFLTGLIAAMLVFYRKWESKSTYNNNKSRNTRLFADPISLQEYQDQSHSYTRVELGKLYKSDHYT